MRKAFIKPLVSLALLVGGVAWIIHSYGFSDALSGVKRLSPLTISLVFSGLLANAFAAALRFKVIVNSTGYPIRFRIALAAVGAGSLAGAVFFQIIGQLIARNIVMRSGSMPFAAVVSVTLYERVFAALLSGLLALVGAVYIFGRFYFDLEAGGAELVKIMFGLTAAAIGGAVLGYGRLALRVVAPLITQSLARTSLAIIGLTLLVQLPMMVAYVGVAHALAPQISPISLFAASAIVMFAASVPISLAGWGVREMSAIVSLGAIGMAGNDALTAAIVIGVGSMLSMAVILLASGLRRSNKEQPSSESQQWNSIDYEQALTWSLPLVAAVFVLFQIHVPIRSGLVNVNLADPVAILAGVLFVLRAIKRRQLPPWRVGYLNLAVAAATVVLGGSLLLGAYRFGWTDWALVNRFSGWFILLAFASTGALIVATGGREAFKTMLLTYVGATAAVALLEITLVFVSSLGAFLPSGLVEPTQINAFAQNRNAFAFQLLMAMAAALVLVRGRNLRVILWAVMLAALWFCGSRSGWISVVCLLAAGLYLNAASFREILRAIIYAACFAFVVALAPVMLSALLKGLGFEGGEWLVALRPQIMFDEPSTRERMITIIGGLKLFLSHPFFGAGLGAFRNEHILDGGGIPLVIHSTPIWVLAELGLVGFLTFSVPAIYVWVTQWLHARREAESAVIVLCFVAFALMSAPADMFYQRTFWLMAGATLAFPRSAADRNNAGIRRC